MSPATRHIGHVANLLVYFALASDEVVPAGWAPRTLTQYGVVYLEIWDILHGMYESQVRFIVLTHHPLISFLCFFTTPGFRSHSSVKYRIRLQALIFLLCSPLRHSARSIPHISFPSNHLHVLFQTQQVLPFNRQQNVQVISCDIAVLLND